MKQIPLTTAPLSIAVSGSEEPIVRRFKNILLDRLERLVKRSVLGVIGTEQLVSLTDAQSSGKKGFGRIETVIIVVDRSSPQARRWFEKLNIADPLKKTVNSLKQQRYDFVRKRLPLRREAIAILLRKAEQINYLLVCLSDQKAAGLGCGWLLNCLRYENGTLYYDPIDGREDQLIIPKQPTRGHMFATHTWSPQLDNMTEAMWREYSEDMALMGTNLLMNLPMHAEEWSRMHFKNGQFIFNDKTIQNKFESYWQVMMKLPQMWKDLGQDYGLWIPANDVLVEDSRWENHLDGGQWCDNACPSDPKERQMILDLRRYVFSSLSHLDIILIPSGDTGGCRCSKCSPWGKTFMDLAVETKNLAKEYHPNVKLVVTNQLVTEDENAAWYKALLDHENQVDYICVSPASDNVEELRKSSRNRFPVFSYLDITHCQFDSNYLRTLGLSENQLNWRMTRTYQTAHLEIIPYSQFSLVELTHRRCGEVEATAPYIEGNHDDVNKFVWTLLDINPDLSETEIMALYARRYFASDSRWIHLCSALEQNMFQDPYKNSSSEQTLNLAKEMNINATDAMHRDFRWPMFLLRAYLDHFMVLYYQTGQAIADILSRYAESDYLPNVCQMLLTFFTEPERWARPNDIYGGCYNEYPHGKDSINPRGTRLTIWPAAPGQKRVFLDEQNYPLPKGFLKRYSEISEKIAQSYQCRDKVGVLSSLLFENHAMEIEAAERIRSCITCIDWARDYLVELAYNRLDKSESRRITDHILHPQLNKGNWFYDDCGRKNLLDKPWDPKRSADPLCVHLAEFTEVTCFVIDYNLANRDSQEVRAYGRPNIIMNYTDLDPAKCYGLRVSYLQNQESSRFQSLWAGKIQLHPAMLVPQKIAREFEFTLPPESYANRDLELLFKYEGGFPENAVVSEVWVYPLR
ncbi:MAG: hypothetical protein ABIG61_04540 [Planctomycetota bacterium]